MNPWIPCFVENKEKLKEKVIELYDKQWRIIKMEYGLYSIQDTMIGFGSPLIFVNEEAAKREYTNWLKGSKNPTDMRFYKVGKFDDQTGVVESMTPVMILGGGNNEGEIQNTMG